jgi:hypothetical protein
VTFEDSTGQHAVDDSRLIRNRWCMGSRQHPVERSGAGSKRGGSLGLGSGGLEGDLATERLELPDVVALGAIGVVVLWVMRHWSPWSAGTFVAALVVMPTSLGTSTSAAVVGGDVDELASVRGGPSRRVALPVVIPNQVGLASLVVAVVPPWLGCGVGP